MDAFCDCRLDFEVNSQTKTSGIFERMHLHVRSVAIPEFDCIDCFDLD